jgi:hypothetical protein
MDKGMFWNNNRTSEKQARREQAQERLARGTGANEFLTRVMHGNDEYPRAREYAKSSRRRKGGFD